MTKTLKISLVLLLLFQILVAGNFGLAHDEAYYWLFSRHLDVGYFDHPPFVAVVIRLFSFLPHSEISVRIGFIFLQFLTLLIVTRMSGSPSISSLLFWSFPLASVTGLLALPDMPLLFMSACYCWGLKEYIEEDRWDRAVVLGIVIALLFYAKYHGVLLVFFPILAYPKFFKRKTFYLVISVALVLFLPHLWWQYQHDFATLRYHFIERPSARFSVGRSLEFVALQVLLAGVLAGPIVWWILLREKTQNIFERSLKFITFGSVLFFLFSSFSKKVEANWTIFLAIPIILLVSRSVVWQKKWCKNLLVFSCLFVLLVRMIFVLPPSIVKIKRAREFHGWQQWAKEVASLCENRPIIANTYQISSKLSFYLEREVPALNFNSRKNQFDFWQFEKKIPIKKVCYITDKSEFEGDLIQSPEEKNLRIIKNQSVESLWRLKLKNSR